MKTNAFCLSIVCAFVASVAAMPAHAYVGPGAGITLIGALIGLVSAIGLALWAVLRWPFRRLMAKRKAAREGRSDAGSGRPGAGSA